jgi:hypothetical protein
MELKGFYEQFGFKAISDMDSGTELCRMVLIFPDKKKLVSQYTPQTP